MNIPAMNIPAGSVPAGSVLAGSVPAGSVPAGSVPAGSVPAVGSPAVDIPVVWSADCLRHEPDGEVWLGVREPGTEIPRRAEVLLAALRAAGAPVRPARPHDDGVLRVVHDAALIDHLTTIWADWEAGGYVSEHGRDRVVPYVFPTAGLLGGLPLRSPAAAHGRAGRFCYDTMTLIGPGSWTAIRAAVDVALTAADLVAAGAPAAYALCRPPGHHASRAAYGGSCYLNNAAVAAQALREAGPAGWRSWTSTRTTATALRRSSITAPTCTTAACMLIRVLAGFRTTSATRRSGAPERAPAPTGTCRWPPVPGTTCGWPPWTSCARRLPSAAPTRWSYRSGWTTRPATRRARCRWPPTATAAPESGFGRLGPVVLVQEGGYDLPSLGVLVAATLAGVAEGAGITPAPGPGAGDGAAAP